MNNQPELSVLFWTQPTKGKKQSETKESRIFITIFCTWCPPCGDLKPWSCLGSRGGVWKPAGKQVLHRQTTDVRRHNWRAVFPSDPILSCCFCMPSPCYLFMMHILPNAITLCDVVTAVVFDVGKRGHSCQRPSQYYRSLELTPPPSPTPHHHQASTRPHVCHAVTFSQRGHSDLVHRQSCWCEARACVRPLLFLLFEHSPNQIWILPKHVIHWDLLTDRNVLSINVHLCPPCAFLQYTACSSPYGLPVCAPFQKMLSHVPVPVSPNRPWTNSPGEIMAWLLKLGPPPCVEKRKTRVEYWTFSCVCECVCVVKSSAMATGLCGVERRWVALSSGCVYVCVDPIEIVSGEPLTEQNNALFVIKTQSQWLTTDLKLRWLVWAGLNDTLIIYKLFKPAPAAGGKRTVRCFFLCWPLFEKSMTNLFFEIFPTRIPFDISVLSSSNQSDLTAVTL